MAFTPFRLGIPGSVITARDIEVHLDPLYGANLSDEILATLAKYIEALLSSGKSPIALDGLNLQTVYNYLRREGSDWSPNNASDSLAYRVGNATVLTDAADHPFSQYTNLDRAHSDVYLIDPSRSGFGGSYPSPLFGLQEDVSSGRATGDLRRRNSLMVVGPPTAQFLDLTGTGWTSPGSLRMLNFNHELQHSLPPAVDPGVISELWSAAAEVVGGVYDTTASSEVPYTWPLMSGPGPSGLDPCSSNPPIAHNRGAGSNYQGRTAFAAYLGYNFLNADTNRTLQGMKDDLLYRWSAKRTQGGRTPTGLVALLGDDSCATCATKSYFHPPGAPLSGIDRFNLLHHNWRVANFANDPTLAEGQYGYPSWSGFSPAKHLKAWQTFDGCGKDDIAAVPAVVQIGANRVLRDTTLSGTRTFRGATMPLILAPLAANYWVFRASPDTWNANRDLVIRISTRTRYAYQGGASSPDQGKVRLMASAVVYSQADSGDESILWQHPEWITDVTTPQWVDTDSLAADMIITVAGFGQTNRSVLLVLSLGDAGTFQHLGTSVAYDEVQPYRIDAMLRAPSTPTLDPIAAAATAGAFEDDAEWSPRSDAIVYMATLPQYSPFTQIYRRQLDGSAPVRILPQEGMQYSPDWSPRGDHIAFVGDGYGAVGNSLWIADLNTYPATPTPLTDLVGYETRLAFRPDGQGVAYTYLPPYQPTHQLRYVAVDGTGDRLLSSFSGLPVPQYSRPVWNAAGTRVYLAVRDSIYSVSRNGGTLTAEPALPQPARSFDLPLGNGAIAVENPVLVNFAKWAVNEGLSFGNPDLPTHRFALIDTAAGRRDTVYRFIGRRTETTNPRLSPDGLRVAFTQRSSSEPGDIFTAPLGWNHAPQFQNLEDVGIEACVSFQMPLSATDADGDAITLKTFQLPPGSQIVNGNYFRWQSPAVGVYYAIFRVLDPRGGVDSRVIRFNVFEGSACGEALAEGGGDGGGFGTRRADANRLQPSPGSGASAGNSLLDGAASDTWMNRVTRVHAERDDATARTSLSLVATRAGQTRLDRVRLLSVDHAPGTIALAEPEGILVAQLEPPLSMTAAEGTTLQPEATSAATEPTLIRAGATVEVVLQSGATGVAVDCARTTGSSLEAGMGIRMQIPAGDSWASGVMLYPRKHRDVLAASTSGSQRVRLVFTADALMWRMNGYRPCGASAADTVRVASVLAQGDGGLHAALGDADAQALAMNPGDGISLAFATPSTVDGMIRTHFLDVRAAYAPPVAEEFGRSRSDAAQLPFALHPSEPNPFDAWTTIRFTVPDRSRVQVEVFDSQGRRVRSVVDAELSAGGHTVRWEGRDDKGRQLSPGVYLCRLRAGGDQQVRRMVLLKQPSTN